MAVAAPEITDATVLLQDLKDKVRALSVRVDDLEQRRLDAALLEFDRFIDLQHDVQCFTADLFGSSASLQPWRDEETDERHFIVHATATGDAAEVLRLNDLWHRRIGEIAGNLSLKFRLSYSLA
jgi:hypothetical protein